MDRDLRDCANLDSRRLADFARSVSENSCLRARRRSDSLKACCGVLVATAHLGNWELSAFAHAWMTAPMNIVVRPLDNARIDAMVERLRSLSGNHIIEKNDAARGILRALAANEAVGILMDQNTTLDQGVFVDFFGMKACAGSAFAKIAHQSGAAVVPGFALWSQEEQRYVLRFYPAIEMTRRCRRRHPANSQAVGKCHPRVPGSMAVDSPAVEDPAAGRAPLCTDRGPAREN